MPGITARNLFAAWQPWQVALASTVAAEMRRHGLTPDDLLALCREYMATHQPAPDEHDAAAPGAAPYASPHGARHNRGDSLDPQARTAQACPRCGALVELVQMCPRYSPHWRTQLACSSEACGWHALSTHPAAYIATHGIHDNVEER